MLKRPFFYSQVLALMILLRESADDFSDCTFWRFLGLHFDEKCRKKYNHPYIMNTKKLSKSIRKFIRKEKARIRREVLDLKKRQELINGLNQQFH